jgi:hypothetical protein
LVVTNLKFADESVVHLLRKELGAVVLNARPPPHVLIAAVVAGALQDAGRHGPHNHAEDEPADGKEGVVHTNLLSSAVASPTVTNEDDNAYGE